MRLSSEGEVTSRTVPVMNKGPLLRLPIKSLKKNELDGFDQLCQLVREELCELNEKEDPRGKRRE